MQQDESNQSAGWVFEPGGEASHSNHSREYSAPSDQTAAHVSKGVSWSASEYVSNPKNAGWFYLLALSSVVFAAIVYFATSDLISSIVIVILGIIVGVFAARQPRVLDYNVGTKGIQIGPKAYPYNGFRSFSVVEDGAFAYVSLMPLRRFMPPLAIHFSPDDEEKIITTLADYLPYEEHKRDVVENLSRRLRF